MPDRPRIGSAIKRARERKRWSQRELAEALGVDRKSVDNWEHDRAYPRSSIGALEQVLGISLDEQPARPGALDDLLPLQEPWEQMVLDHPDLPDDLKRRMITDSRAARAQAAERRRRRREEQEAARLRDRAAG